MTSFSFAVEDLNLSAVESLRGVPYLAIGKHLCGPATGELAFLLQLSNDIHNNCQSRFK